MLREDHAKVNVSTVEADAASAPIVSSTIDNTSSDQDSHFDDSQIYESDNSFGDIGNSLLDEIEREIQCQLDAQIDDMMEQQWNEMMQEHAKEDSESTDCVDLAYQEWDDEMEAHGGNVTSIANDYAEGSLDDLLLLQNMTIQSTARPKVKKSFNTRPHETPLLPPASAGDSTVESIQATIQQVLQLHGYQ